MEQRITRISLPKYSFGEELFNSISHGIGTVLSVVALVLLACKAQGVLAMATSCLFGVSMVLLYVISCVYHALPPTLFGKRVLRVVDHCNVYLLVFGTYIPVSLLGVGGALGWVLFGVVCLFTVIGIVFTAIDVDRFSLVQVVCHLVSGWSILFGVIPLLETMGQAGFGFLLLGGIMYSVGSGLYALGKSRTYMHCVFHVFCLFGTFFHFLTVYWYLL